MRLRKLLGVGLVATMMAVGQAGSAGADSDAEYTLEILEPGAEQIVSSGLGINDAGDAVGITRPASSAQPQFSAIWPAGQVEPEALPQLEGSRFSRAFDLNNDQVAVGEAFDADGATVPIRWIDGVASVGEVPQGDGRGLAADIANNGSVVGTAARRAYLVAGGTATDLPLPDVDEGEIRSTRASAISDSSEYVVGTTQVAVPHDGHTHNESLLTVWHQGAATAHPSETDGLTLRVHGVNDSGLVVGYVAVNRVTTAVQWRDGGMTRLGNPEAPDMPHTSAMAVNNDGVVVGNATKFADSWSFGGIAVRWIEGRPVDLNTLVDAPEGVVLQSASDINASGQIVGTAMTPDGQRAFRLTPVQKDPDPSPDPTQSPDPSPSPDPTQSPEPTGSPSPTGSPTAGPTGEPSSAPSDAPDKPSPSGKPRPKGLPDTGR
ncbi:hypothetical protein [Enemella sp. A6]|uniref:hypothetical protein n=1 Tax=Enemella sp. A6 TaxID=3440152 RepID=UPI003EBC5214